MTIAALDLGLVELAIPRLKAAPGAFRAAAAGSTPIAANLTAWADELAGIKTLEPTLSIGDSTPPQVPAVTVHLLNDECGPDLAPEVGAVQRATAVLAVVHVIRSINSPRAAGGDAVDPLGNLLGATRAALHGWRPYRWRGADAVALLRGRLLGPPSDGRVAWQDEYVFRWVAQVYPDVQQAFNSE